MTAVATAVLIPLQDMLLCDRFAFCYDCSISHVYTYYSLKVDSRGFKWVVFREQISAFILFHVVWLEKICQHCYSADTLFNHNYSCVDTHIDVSLQWFLLELDYPHHYCLPQLQPVSAMLVGHASECRSTFSAIVSVLLGNNPLDHHAICLQWHLHPIVSRLSTYHAISQPGSPLPQVHQEDRLQLWTKNIIVAASEIIAVCSIVTYTLTAL